MKIARHNIFREDIDKGVCQLHTALLKALDKVGYGAFVSNHEGLGAVTEEYHELIAAVKSNDNEAAASEFLDIAVSALFGYISIVSTNVERR